MDSKFKEIMKGYEKAIQNVKKWVPKKNPSDQKDIVAIEAWRKKTIAKIEAGRKKAVSNNLKEVSMAKVIKIDRKIMNVLSMGVVVKQDVKMGLLKGKLPGAEFKQSGKLAKGTKASIKLIGISFNGLVLKVNLKGGSKFIVIDDHTSVQRCLDKYFEPVIKSYHICSIIPAKVRSEMMKLQIRVYQERPSREKYSKQIAKVLKIAA